jgi:hypothetical protein
MSRRCSRGPHHPDDDHNFSLTIPAGADRFVTRETRIRNMGTDFPADAARLLSLAPKLRIVEPHEFAAELKSTLEPK